MQEDKLKDIMSKYLIDLRKNKAKLSQNDVAERSQVFDMESVLDQRAVSRIEKDPLKADAIKIAGYMTAIGQNPSDYYAFMEKHTIGQKNTGLVLPTSGEEAEMINEALEKIEEAKKIAFSAPCREVLDGLKLTEAFDQAARSIENERRKPVIGCFGRFDSGKSTLINTILGQKVMPEAYQPATSVVNLIMHEDDRPVDLTGSVALFRKGFLPSMMYDGGQVQDYLIEDGGVDILERLGVHQYDGSIPTDAYISIVFVQNDLLRSVWLLDTPGDMSHDGSDTEKALSGAELADGVLFTSPATGFFDNLDLGLAANVLRHTTPVDPTDPLAHVLFIQSHSHPNISGDAIRSIGSKAMLKRRPQFKEFVFDSWEENGVMEKAPSAEELTTRVQPFWRETKSLRESAISRVIELAEYLAKNRERIIVKNIHAIIDLLHGAIDGTMADLEYRKQDSSVRLEELKAKDARFREESKTIIAEFEAIINSIEGRKNDDLATLDGFFHRCVNVEYIAATIKNLYDDKDEAARDIGDHISQTLTTHLESTLTTSGKHISSEVQTLLGKWQKVTPMRGENTVPTEASGLNVGSPEFDSVAAFIGGFAALSSLGAMAIFVSTIASNLGAYILVGKAAGVLVSLGLVGSVTTVTSFVAAIGGPITIGLALASILGYLVFRLFSDSWQEALAKKVVKAINNEDAWEDIEATAITFWESTTQAIENGLDALKNDTEEHLAKLFEEAKENFDTTDLEIQIRMLKKAKTYLD